MNICELLFLLPSKLLLLVVALVVMIFLFYTTHIFFLCLKSCLQEWTLLLHPNQCNSVKPKMPSGLILFSLSKCPDLASILLWDADVTGWPGPALIPGGAREGCGGFRQANITAVLNYHKQMLAAWHIRNAIQSPCQSNPLTRNSRDRETVRFPFPCSGLWRLLPLSWRKLSASKDSMWQSSMGIRTEILNWSRLYSPTGKDERHFCVTT